MQNMIVNFIDQFGYLGVFFLITLENIFPPIRVVLVRNNSIFCKIKKA